MNINCAKCGKENIIKQLAIMVYHEVIDQFPELKEYQGKHICDECLHDICMLKIIDNK